MCGAAVVMGCPQPGAAAGLLPGTNAAPARWEKPGQNGFLWPADFPLDISRRVQYNKDESGKQR